MIIDFHTHTFPEKIAHRVLDGLSNTGHVLYAGGGYPGALAESMKEGGSDLSVNLPVATRADQVASLNSNMIRDKEKLAQMGILTFGAMHPGCENYKEELRRLKEAGIPGVKFHPAFAQIDLDDIRYLRMIDEASELGLIVITHAGLDVSFLDHDYASVEHILKVVEEVKPEKFVLAHMGGWQNWKQVESDLAGAPVWIDTSYSLGPVVKKPGHEAQMPYDYNMTGVEFTRLVRKHGTDHVLFGTDWPWSGQSEFIGFVKESGLDEAEQKLVFEENARKLLGLQDL